MSIPNPANQDAAWLHLPGQESALRASQLAHHQDLDVDDQYQGGTVDGVGGLIIIVVNEKYEKLQRLQIYNNRDDRLNS